MLNANNVLNVIELIGIIVLIILMCKVDKLTDKRKPNVTSTSEEDFLTSYEIEKLEREAKFDERIERLKNEIAEEHPINTHSEPAEELHPNVHNIPHEVIKDTSEPILPDVEITK